MHAPLMFLVGVAGIDGQYPCARVVVWLLRRYVTLRLTILVQFWLVTDRRMDRHTMTAYTVLDC